ncbi:HNH endonuclease [Halococcus dombrowskii]|nr:HNH endonuclease [Halococcus dombrowskii]
MLRINARADCAPCVHSRSSGCKARRRSGKPRGLTAGSVHKRDNWTCQSCGHMSGPHAGDEGRSLHSHHIISLSKGGSHKFSNLETLCGVCHNNQHHHDIFASDSRGSTLSHSALHV